MALHVQYNMLVGIEVYIKVCSRPVAKMRMGDNNYTSKCPFAIYIINPATLGTVQLGRNSEVATFQKIAAAKNDLTSKLNISYARDTKSVPLGF